MPGVRFHRVEEPPLSPRGRDLLIFVGILMGLRLLGLRVSILGSLVLTFVVWLVITEFAKRR